MLRLARKNRRKTATRAAVAAIATRRARKNARANKSGQFDAAALAEAREYLGKAHATRQELIDAAVDLAEFRREVLDGIDAILKMDIRDIDD